MNNKDLIIKASEWIESLNGTQWELHFKFSEKDLIQIGKNRLEIEKQDELNTIK